MSYNLFEKKATMEDTRKRLLQKNKGFVMVLGSFSPGFVALVTVLIIGAVTLVMASGMSLRSLDATKASIGAEDESRAMYLATSCVEEALRQIRLNRNYTGGVSLIFPAGTCSIVSVTRAGTLHTINTQSIVGGSVRKLLVRARRATTGQMTITSWDDIP